MYNNEIHSQANEPCTALIDEDLEINEQAIKRNIDEERFSSISKLSIQELIERKSKLKKNCTSLKDYIRSLESRFDTRVYMKKMESIEKRVKSAVEAFEKWLVEVN